LYLGTPDHVSVVIHNYRWRLGLADGERQYDDLDKRLALGPMITVPTITLEGDANGAPHPDSSAYGKKFSGKYAHRVINGGIGHNLPQEAPRAFAKRSSMSMVSDPTCCQFRADKREEGAQKGPTAPVMV
jgi:hypothetical protein